MAGNPISDRSQFLKLKSNINLANLDLEGTIVTNNEDSLLFIVYILPQLSILNRNFIDMEFRRRAAERFERQMITDLNNQISSLDKELQLLQDNNNNLHKQMENNKSNQQDTDQLQKIIQKLQSENEKQKDVIQLRSDELAEERKKNAELITQLFPNSDDDIKDGFESSNSNLNQQAKDKIESLEKENEELKRTVSSLQYEIGNLNSVISQNKEEKIALENSIADLKNQLKEANQQISILQSTNNSLKEELKEEKQISAKQKEFIDSLEHEIEEIRLSQSKTAYKPIKTAKMCEERIHQLEDRNETLETTVNSLNNKVSQKQNEIDKLNDEIKKLKLQLIKDQDSDSYNEVDSVLLSSNLNEENEKLRNENVNLIQSIDNLRKQNNSLLQINEDLTHELHLSKIESENVKDKFTEQNEKSKETIQILNDNKNQINKLKKQVQLKEMENQKLKSQIAELNQVINEIGRLNQAFNSPQYSFSSSSKSENNIEIDNDFLSNSSNGSDAMIMLQSFEDMVHDLQQRNENNAIKLQKRTNKYKDIIEKVIVEQKKKNELLQSQINQIDQLNQQIDILTDQNYKLESELTQKNAQIATLSSIETNTDKLKHKQQKEIVKLRNDFDREIRKVKIECEKKIKAQNEKIAAEKEKLVEDIKNEELEKYLKLSDEIQKKEEEIDEKSRQIAQLEILNDKNRKLYNNKLKENEELINENKRNYESQIEDLRIQIKMKDDENSKYKNDFDQQINKYTNENSLLKKARINDDNEKRQLQLTISQLKNENKNYQDKITNLQSHDNQNQTIISNLKNQNKIHQQQISNIADEIDQLTLQL